MALAKKKSRKINVNGIIYRWKAKFDDYPTISIFIELEENPVNRIVTGINSDEYTIREQFHIFEDGTWRYQLSPQIKITPVIIRSIILLALNSGWEPYLKSKPFLIMELDKKIDLNLSKEILGKIEFSKDFSEYLVESCRNKYFNNCNCSTYLTRLET